MLGHEGQPRLGAPAFGGVHQRQQDRRPVAVDELARIDRQVDQRAVGPDVLPGPRRALLAGIFGGPWRLDVEGLQAADREFLELAAAVTVMLHRGVVDGENTLVPQCADNHRYRIAVEQQAKRSLALLQLGDVDTQTDDAAILGEALVDQDDAAVGQRLLVSLARREQLLEPRGDPFFLAADRFRVIAAGNADADRIFQSHARLEQVGGSSVHLCIFLVPENVAAVSIENDHALRKHVDRLPQALLRFARFGQSNLERGIPARGLASCRTAVDRQFRCGLRWPAGEAGNRRLLRLSARSRLLRHRSALLAHCAQSFRISL